MNQIRPEDPPPSLARCELTDALRVAYDYDDLVAMKHGDEWAVAHLVYNLTAGEYYPLCLPSGVWPTEIEALVAAWNTRPRTAPPQGLAAEQGGG